MRSKAHTILAILLSLAGQEWICLTHQHCLSADCHINGGRHRHETEHHCRCEKHKHSTRHTQHRSVAVCSEDLPAPGPSHRCCAESSPVIAETEQCRIDVIDDDLTSVGPHRRTNERSCRILTPRSNQSTPRLHIRFCALLC